MNVLTRTSVMVFFITWLLSFSLFYADSSELMSSLFASFLTAALVWMVCVMLKILYLALKK